ncbi:MAG: hypothetical protein A3I44_05600 [Candidatus Sungbacteria bacterium RIFCSPLOWO2_02_FULL_51_17]|uniref:Uncharacterized protein n=1 Tax=Candidatus Sungbacteria bacterium RIFCSPHIGHO2_02_FULL_51_29 TaxID=1802273 RepID=A0A1G2KTP2_9BACT|nr:MAG: hypothetical protein A2676_04930 [Candidatus Sungbacteria bacterium RIFCSPHIGHO2_01_FULL_51_22]OHA01982.1 MAG: hypothetical protein A3C16_02480 [Candidatus Sungbacteria bacterium RIFCSPHIGHO2_02_FULL_51_29]OHA06506.1 MAG: hypothetical protein A3B29_03020 [Candidatus Sungbacteria bacterium RIFCSPLOWO2_01_FULL_51_34]OHA11168.1 MAG: hypothetical protein A3I44_05600 [Candidatus Sungbacteria bacterium RIFCSPLOWO2_02_FULL_51_17]
MNATEAILRLKDLRRTLLEEAQPAFEEADRFRKKIMAVDESIRSLCHHPKEYLRHEQVETSPTEHRVNCTTCNLCERMVR